MFRIIKRHKFMKEFYQDVFAKRSCLEYNIDNVETFAVGGSHLQYGINPSYFESFTLNMGFTSLDWYGTWHLLKIYGKRMPKLKNVIVRMSLFTPGYDLPKTNQAWRCIYYRKLLDIPYHVYGRCKKFITIKKWNEETLKEYDNPNYKGYNPNLLFGKDDANERMYSHLKNFYRKTDQMSYFHKIEDWCHAHKVRLLVCFPPYRSDYLSQIPECIHQKLKSYIKDPSEIYDFWGDTDFEDSDFGDTDHLNPKGAIKFSKKLNEILKKD